MVIWAGLAAQFALAQPAAPSYVPLNSHERWKRYWDESFLSPGLYFAALGSATFAQLANDPPEWRQGAAGYGRRSVSLLGLFAMDVTIHEGGAAVLGYDPRYFHCKCTGLLPRTGHALVWSFITHDNKGRVRIDFPALAGAYGSGMLSMYWYPHRYSPLTDGVRVGTQDLGFQIGVNVLREFGPEIKRVFRRK